MRLPALPRYGPLARFYDALSGERPVYRAGREAGIPELRLTPGGSVLDVGCGTGLNFPYLHDAVGPSGRIVGVDASGAMLAQADARTATQRWRNVETRRGDAARLAEVAGGERVDAVLFTYALSIIDGWERSFADAVRLAGPGGRIVVVDMALPSGRWAVLSPLARLACFTGGADPHRHPWRMLETELIDVAHRVLRGGHIHVVSGTVPDPHHSREPQ